MAGNKRSLALLAHQNVGRDQIADSGPDGENRDAEAISQLAFSGQLLAGLPLTFREALEDAVSDLFIQRVRAADVKLRGSLFSDHQGKGRSNVA